MVEGWPREAERYMSRLVFTITWMSKMISLVSLATCFAAEKLVWCVSFQMNWSRAVEFGTQFCDGGKSPDFWRKWSDV